MRTAGVTWTGGRAAKEPSPLTLPLQPCLPKDGGQSEKQGIFPGSTQGPSAAAMA
jgi:hypothetical protein